MKWFKFYCNLSMDNKIVGMMDEVGVHTGFASYVLLLEHCARVYEGNSPVFNIRMKTLKQILSLSGRKIDLFFKSCEENSLFTYTLKGNLYSINWPYLAEIADEYTIKKSKNIRRKSGDSHDIVSLDKIRKDKNIKSKIGEAIMVFGKYRAKEAKESLGPEVWEEILDMGGWYNLCSKSSFQLDQSMSNNFSRLKNGK